MLLGSYAEQRSPITAPSNITDLRVHLQAGETWRFEPPAGHTTAWPAMGEGTLHAPDALHTGGLADFEQGGQAIEFEAQSDTNFVLGSGAVHPHPLHKDPYSVHTSSEALRAGQQGIRDRAALLRTQRRQ